MSHIDPPHRISASNDASKEPTTTLSPTPSSLATSHSLMIKAAYRKADTRMLLCYSFVYLIMRIHVQNVTKSAIMNLRIGHGIKAQPSGLSSEQWAMLISIFYCPYMFLEPSPPATLLLKLFSPSKWMARIVIAWGCHQHWRFSSACTRTSSCPIILTRRGLSTEEEKRAVVVNLSAMQSTSKAKT